MRFRQWASTVLCVVLVCRGAGAATREEAAEARGHASQATRAYDLSQFDVALAGYLKAFELDPRPALLFNIAQCYRHLGDYERAAFYYRRYLDRSPGRPANAEQVEALILEVEARQAERLRAGAASPTAPGAPAPHRAGASDAGLVLTPAPAASPSGDEPVLSAVPPDAAPTPAVPSYAAPTPLHRQWWFWTGVGVLAAGAVVGTALAVSGGPAKTSLETIDAR